MPITREFFVYIIWDSWYDLWVINCLFGGVLLPFLLPITRIPFPDTPMWRLVEMINAAIPSHGVTGVLVVAFVFWGGGKGSVQVFMILTLTKASGQTFMG